MSAAPARAYQAARPLRSAPATPSPPHRRDHLRPVESPAPGRSLAPVVWLCLAVIVASLGLMLVINTAMAEGAYERRDIKLELASLHHERASLVTVLEANAAPQHLAQAATELGMVPAESLGYISLTQRHAAVAEGMDR